MDFRPLFKPKSMAVIGVSLQNERHPANVIYNKTLLRYPVDVFPVNPKGGLLQGGNDLQKKFPISPEKSIWPLWPPAPMPFRIS